MNDLTDDRLADIEGGIWHRAATGDEVRCMVAEIRRNRAMVERLEAWAAHLDRPDLEHNDVGSWAIAAELRYAMAERIKGG